MKLQPRQLENTNLVASVGWSSLEPNMSSHSLFLSLSGGERETETNGAQIISSSYSLWSLSGIAKMDRLY